MNEGNIIDTLEFVKGIKYYVKTEREKLLDFIREFAKRYKEEKHKLPYHLNVIDELHINENAHSRILMKLLCYKNEKEEYEILQSLLEYMQSKKEAFSSISIENPTITQEEQRIDLWVRDNDYAIIFENKIYNAKDQEAQISRYIESTTKTKEKNYEENKIFVIYLSQDGKEPDDQTWGDYKDKFKDRYLNLSFRYDILRWLRERVLPNVRHKDDYLKCALKQYIDYLEGLFELRTIQKPMIMTLKEIIQKKLELENKKPQDCFSSITEEIESCNKLLESLNSLREEYRHDCWKEGTKNRYPNYKPNEAGYFTDVTLNQKDGKELLVIVSDDNDNKGVYCQVEYRDKSIIDGTLIEKLNSFLDETNAKYRKENSSTQIWKYFKNDPKGAYEKFNEVVDYLIKELENR